MKPCIRIGYCKRCDEGSLAVSLQWPVHITSEELVA